MFSILVRFLCVLMLSIAVVPQAAAEEVLQANAHSELEALLDEAQKNNPQILAAQERLKASQSQVAQAWALPDPMFGYVFMGEMIETRLGPQEAVYELEQRIPFPGKLWQERQMAQADTRGAQSAFDAVALDVSYAFSSAYYDLAAVDANLLLVEDLLSALSSVEGIAQSRYASGQGSQRDVAKAQAEVSAVLQQRFVFEQQRASLAARINSLLNRPVRTPVDTALLEPLPAGSLDLDELLAQAQQHQPELLKAQAELKKAKHASRLAKMENLPDVSVGFQYIEIGNGTTTMPNDGEDAWMIPVKISIPLWQNRILPKISEARHAHTASRHDLQQAQVLSSAEVSDAYYRFTTAKQIVALYEEALIPQAELAFQSDSAGYESGRVDVLNLLDSERMYLNVRMAYHQALAEGLKDFKALEREVGAKLQPLEGDSK